MLVFVALFIIHACIASTIPATPENITVTFLTPTSVRVSWQTILDLQTHPIEKYVVTYKPTDDRVVQQVAGNSEAVVLDRLSPNTQYQITVTAVWAGKKYRSRQVIFRTLDLPKNSLQQDQGLYFGSGTMAPHGSSGNSVLNDDTPLPLNNNSTHPPIRELPPIRGVEVGIVLIVLLVWAGAIALFFNRWGKIRMLLPYQPDYKQEQLKVPGTGVCTGSVCNGQHSHQNLLHPDMLIQCEGSEMGSIAPLAPPLPQTITQQHFHYLQDEPSTTISERCTRSRINSAIFVSSEGRGFDSIEFLRRHGSQSVLCRKAKSAENISDEDRKRRFSENQQWSTIDSNNPSETIEIAECHEAPSTSGITVSVNATPSPSRNAPSPYTAIVTASNTIVVGSISIETPPPHIQQQQREKQQEFANQISTSPRSQSPTVSRSGSPVSLLNQKNPPKLRPPKLKTNLPTLSISGPSPPHDEEFL